MVFNLALFSLFTEKNVSNLLQITSFEKEKTSTEFEDQSPENVKRHFHHPTTTPSLLSISLDKQYEILEELEALPQPEPLDIIATQLPKEYYSAPSTNGISNGNLNAVTQQQYENNEHHIISEDLAINNLPVGPIIPAENPNGFTQQNNDNNEQRLSIESVVNIPTEEDIISTPTITTTEQPIKQEEYDRNNMFQMKADTFQTGITKVPETLLEAPPTQNDDSTNTLLGENNQRKGDSLESGDIIEAKIVIPSSTKQPITFEQLKNDAGGEDDPNKNLNTNVDLNISSISTAQSQNDEPNAFVTNIQSNVTEEESFSTDSSEFSEQSDTTDSLLNGECPDSIQSEDQKLHTSPHHCLLYSEFFDTCSEARKYYPKHTLTKTLRCKTRQYEPICEYVNHGDEKRLQCNTKVCAKNTLKVGKFVPRTGGFLYKKVRNDLELLQSVEHERYMQTALAPFVFLTCQSKYSLNKKIKQIVAFEETILDSYPEKHQRKNNLPDVNVVVIDSLSRQHFYRLLPVTVKAMKSINSAKSSESEVLDFKGMQSLAPFTYVNIHALMNGTIDNKNHNKGATSKRDYPMQNVFSAFKAKGYRTLLQEDSCWHDRWGSLFNGNEKVPDSTEKETLWKDIQNTISNWNVDDYGMTYITCEALKKYKLTSLFDSTQMLCLNGKPISTYHIDHLLERATTPTSKTNKPILSYTHINFGHEKTGRRIRALDKGLARLMNELSAKKNAITILMSDHGGKQSKYSINTIQGRYEVYDSMLFMIIPKSLQTTLGESVYKTLLANQNSLITVLDVRDTILKLLELDTLKANTYHDRSLFSNAPAERRGCQTIGIRKYALCKCLTNVNIVSPKDTKYRDFLLWLAEYAVGYLNNKLAGYHEGKSIISPRCRRVQAKTIRLAMEQGTDYGTMYTFDIITENLAENSDIFNFRMFYNNKRNSTLPLMEMNNWDRISIYQNYAFCRDKNVPLDMCICSNKSKFKFSNRTEVSEYKQFGVKSYLSTINDIVCLILMRRDHGNVVTFEVANTCSRKVHLTFGIQILYSWQVNQALPVEVIVESSQIVFIATFIKGIDMVEKLEPAILTFWS